MTQLLIIVYLLIILFIPHDKLSCLLIIMQNKTANFHHPPSENDKLIVRCYFGSRSSMEVERECIAAFYSADKPKALYYLQECSDPSKIRTKSPATVNGILFIWNISLLHIAAKNNWPDIASKLIGEHNCEPEPVNNRLSTPLHYAARFGSLETLRLLIEDYYCDPMRLTTNKWTALHWAASKGQLIILQYLIEVCQCDASLPDIKGHTLLHLACADNHTDTVVYLLKTGLIDPSFKDIWDCTPSQWGKSTLYDKNKPQAIELLEYFEKSRLNAPVDTYTQVFVFGDKGAGKSSLIKVLKERSKAKSYETITSCCSCDDDGNVKDVKLHTIGIIPENIQSQEIGNMIVYDLAGDAEYHYSHAAVMKRAVNDGWVTFVLLVNISLNLLSIKKQIYYWFNFVNVLCHSSKLNVLIVGSHSDLITIEDCHHKGVVITGILSKYYPQSRTSFIPMDCRKVMSSEIVQVSKKLLLSSLPLLAKSINLNYHCHALYLFLKQNKDKVYCQLDALSSMIRENGHDKFLPIDQPSIVELLQMLSRKGLIIFLQRPDVANSWVIIDIDVFLHDINGVLFSPTHDLSSISNIGVIPLHWIKECFPNHCPILLSDVFSTLGVCHKITASDSDDSNKYYFFPSFLTFNRPTDQLPSHFDFKWILKCKNDFNFFTVHFCHMLLVRIALKFPLQSISGVCSPTSWLPQVSRRCQIWKFGIHWKTDDFIENLVEVSNDKQQVTLVMNSMDPDNINTKEMLTLRSAIIKEILSVFNECCSSLEIIEMLEHAIDDTSTAPESSQCSYYAMEDIVRIMCLRKKGVLDCKGQTCVHLKKLIPNEPFAEIPQEILVKIFISDCEGCSKEEEPILMTQYQKDQINSSLNPRLFLLKDIATFETFKSRIELLSIFNGRTNIIEKAIKAYFPLIQKTIQEATRNDSCTVTISGVIFSSDDLPNGLLDSSDLVSIICFLKPFNRWFEMGLQLGLHYTTLKQIENDYPREESRCKVEMIVKWLDNQSPTQPPTRLAIMKALKELE